MSTQIAVFECEECGNRTKIYSRDEPAVFCQCEPEGPPMIEVSETGEDA